MELLCDLGVKLSISMTIQNNVRECEVLDRRLCHQARTMAISQAAEASLKATK